MMVILAMGTLPVLAPRSIQEAQRPNRGRPGKKLRKAAITKNNFARHVRIAGQKTDRIRDLRRLRLPAYWYIGRKLLERPLSVLLRYKIPPRRVHDTWAHRIDADRLQFPR